MKRTHTILATITLISVILTSACTAGNASSTTSSVPETAVTTTTAPAVMDRIDEPKAEATTAQTRLPQPQHQLPQSHRKQR